MIGVDPSFVEFQHIRFCDGLSSGCLSYGKAIRCYYTYILHRKEEKKTLPLKLRLELTEILPRNFLYDIKISCWL